MNVPIALRLRIARLMNFKAMHHLDGHKLESLTEALTDTLRAELQLFVFDTLVQKAVFFQDVSMNVRKEVVLAFDSVVYAPHELVITKGAIGLELFFVIRGDCDIFLNDLDWTSPLAAKSVGTYFGEIGLVCDVPRTAYVRARFYCFLAKLSREPFRKVCLDFVDEGRTICDSILRNVPGGKPPPPTAWVTELGVGPEEAAPIAEAPASSEATVGSQGTLLPFRVRRPGCLKVRGGTAQSM